MDHYIIRIYRRDKTDNRVLVGTLEDVEQGAKKAFNRPDELWALLNPEQGKTAARSEKDKRRAGE